MYVCIKPASTYADMYVHTAITSVLICQSSHNNSTNTQVHMYVNTYVFMHGH